MKIKCNSTDNMKINLNGYDTDLSSNDLTVNDVYEVISIENGWYRIIDNSGEDYLYPAERFEIIDDLGYEELKKFDETHKLPEPKKEEKTA